MYKNPILTNTILLDKAVEIADKLEDNVHQWIGIGASDNHNILKNHIVVLSFFTEISRHGISSGYTPLIEALIKIPINNKLTNWGFYNGNLGAYYYQWKAALALDIEPCYKFNDFKKQIDLFVQSEYTNNSLFNGRAGTLLGLLKIFQDTQDPEVLSSIKHTTCQMLRHGKAVKEGLLWEPSPNSIKGLTGWGHGASGIGFALFQLSKFFKDDFFLAYGEDSLRFEDFYWDDKSNNWPDFRKEINDSDTFNTFRKAYQDNNTSFFEPSYENYTWEHGGLGIGLARLDAYEASHNKKHLTHLGHIIEKISLNDHDLPLQLLAEQTLLKRANEVLDNENIEAALNKILEKTLLTHDIKIEKCSSSELALMGLYYLASADVDIDAIVYPVISDKAASKSSINEFFHDHQIQLSVIDSSFPNTLAILKESSPKELHHFFELHKKFSPKDFVAFCEKIDCSNWENGEIFLYTLEMENTMLTTLNSIDNYAMLYQKELSTLEENASLLATKESILLDKPFVLSTNLVTIPKNLINTTLIDLSQCSESEFMAFIRLHHFAGVTVIQTSSQSGTRIISLSIVDIIVLNQFVHMNTINNVCNSFRSVLIGLSSSNRELLMSLFGVVSFDALIDYVSRDIKINIKDAIDIGILIRG